MSFHFRSDAHTDALTGAGNRRSFETQLTSIAKKLKGSIRKSHNMQGCIISIDLDLFKPVNDTYGMAAGDQVLFKVVERLKEMKAGHLKYDVHRAGGDEIYIVVTDPRTRILKVNWVNHKKPLTEIIDRYKAITFQDYVKDVFGPQIDDAISELYVVPTESVHAGKSTKVQIGISWGIAFFSGHSNESINSTLDRSHENLHQNKAAKKAREEYMDLRRITGQGEFETVLDLCSFEDRIDLNFDKFPNVEVIFKLREIYDALPKIETPDGVIILEGNGGNIGNVNTADVFRELLNSYGLNNALRYFDSLTGAPLAISNEDVRLIDPIETGRGAKRNLPVNANVAPRANLNQSL